MHLEDWISGFSIWVVYIPDARINDEIFLWSNNTCQISKTYYRNTGILYTF